MSLSLTGCNGAMLGNLLVVGVTVGIFFGTLSLGRTHTKTNHAEQSTSRRA